MSEKKDNIYEKTIVCKSNIEIIKDSITRIIYNYEQSKTVLKNKNINLDDMVIKIHRNDSYEKKLIATPGKQMIAVNPGWCLISWTSREIESNENCEQ